MLNQFDLDSKARRKPRKSGLVYKFFLWLGALFFILHYVYLLVQNRSLNQQITSSVVGTNEPNSSILVSSFKEQSSNLAQMIQEVQNDLNVFAKSWQQSGQQATQAQSVLSSVPEDMHALKSKVDQVIGEVKSLKYVVGDNTGSQYTGERKKIRAFIGVFTGFNIKGTDDPKYDYVKRRIAMRDTWFPENQNVIDDLEREQNYVIRYVIGHINNQTLEDQIAYEHEKYGGFMRIDHMESYSGLPQKTLKFFSLVASQYDADYIIKIDDDVYLKFDRLEAGMKQWEKMGADYIGCMKHGQVWKTPGTRWYEPAHLMLASDYYLHAYGSFYIISGDVAHDVILLNKDKLRMLANEDTSVGMWMLGHNVTYFEDMRLCTPGCSIATIGVLNNACAGLCDPLTDLYTVHQHEKCTAEVQDPLPYLPSYPDHKDFESMRV
eukprot:TRINITY_DN1779_c0_g3_i1.p1 TRINITY_DN1779_c0_g3~~TRINITY_DN1779_c0_g3_i1.p1  ORF type:complete len:500 (-),score=47.29 TRINITY_DN1779_c0_g3_i1:810-2114(-)